MSEAPLLSTLVERLRGVYRLGVNDGAGLLDGKDTFTSDFGTTPIKAEAADYIEKLTAQRDALLGALKGLVELDCPIRGVDPFGPKVVEHWKEQEAQGHGYADLYLNALAAIRQATGEGE